MCREEERDGPVGGERETLESCEEEKGLKKCSKLFKVGLTANSKIDRLDPR